MPEADEEEADDDVGDGGSTGCELLPSPAEKPNILSPGVKANVGAFSEDEDAEGAE